MRNSDKPDSPKSWRPSTKLVHGGMMRSEWSETSEAMFLTSGYVYDNAAQAAARMAGDEPGFVYSRYANPTVRMFEEKMALLEGAEDARATASGMAAIHAALIAPCQTGDRIVAARALFSSCRWILSELAPRYGIAVDWVDGAELADWERALSHPAKLVLIESPSNPLLDAVDISAVAELSHKAGAKLIVDNVFATPVLQRPLELGADWVVYSATKHIDGHGRVLGGVILAPKADIEDILQPFLRHTGPALSPFNAWVLLKGMDSLALRVQYQSKTCSKLADFLAEQKSIAHVRYPGRNDHPHRDIHAKQMDMGGTLLAFSLKGGQNAAFKLLDMLSLIKISNNLGDSKSLACHPASTTHRTLSEEERKQIGLDHSWIRLSVGLEDVEDLMDDLAYALSEGA